jgi:mannose-6-phosphate isomerase-like protein (cupin superfamily)
MTGLPYEVERARAAKDGYHEFLRTSSLSVGVYVLAAGADDRQHPHGEDEIYYVLEGQGKFRNGTSESLAETGDVLFVPAHQPHRFHSISQELVLLVVFAPPEGSAGAAPRE